MAKVLSPLEQHEIAADYLILWRRGSESKRRPRLCRHRVILCKPNNMLDTFAFSTIAKEGTERPHWRLLRVRVEKALLSYSGRDSHEENMT